MELLKQIENFMLPEHANNLYEKEALSSIHLSKEVADKINELVAAYNQLASVDLEWKQVTEGKVNSAVVFMKDNLINSLNELLKLYDDEMIKNTMLEMYGVELNQLKVFATPQMFGAVGDGITNDTEAIEKAIQSLEEGGVLYFPKGEYLMTGKPVEIVKSNITFTGEGLILCDYGFRPMASNFKAQGMRMKATSYSMDCRAFLIDAFNNAIGYVKNFTFKDCYFENFFYSVCAVGGAYDHDGTEAAVGFPVRDLVVENCYSITHEDQNAGHFQCIQVENISYINNRTYGGKNASSYNAIKGNGFIRVIGNYEHNNSFASSEIENGSGKAVIANNTFNSKIWVDDSFDAVIVGNTTEQGITVTVGSDVGESSNVVISNNVCRNIRCEQFGTYTGGVIDHLNIIGNNVKGDNTHGIWLHGNAVKKAKVTNNFISGNNTNDIAVQRNTQLDCYIDSNFGNGNKLLIAGSGGKVYAIDNYNFTSSGTRDSLSVSHLEKSFNGLKITDTNNVPWRLNVNTSGEVYTTKY